MNEKKREAENLAKIDEIQSMLVGKKAPILVAPARRFHSEGPCTLHKQSNEKDPREGYICLFNDLILISKYVFFKQIIQCSVCKLLLYLIPFTIIK